MTKKTHTAPKYGMRPPEVAEAFGSRTLFEQAVKAGLLKPMICRHKLTIYDSGHVAQAWARILAGELNVTGNLRGRCNQAIHTN